MLYQMPEVELAAAVGVPDAVYGEEVACFIRLKKGRVLSEQQVKNWCEARIASYKVPRKVFFVDEIPQGGNGKIQRLKLLDVYKACADESSFGARASRQVCRWRT